MPLSTTTRPPELHHRSRGPRARRETNATASSLVVLAYWQLHQTWRLLLVVGAGLLAAVMLVCAISLYTRVAESAGLRHTLEADPHNMYVSVHSSNSLFSSSVLKQVQQKITRQMQGALGPAISHVPDLSVQVSTLALGPDTHVRLVGTDMERARQHLKLLRGRLPSPASGDVVEFASTPGEEDALRLRIGETLHVPYNLVNTADQTTTQNLTLRLVGTFVENGDSASFWHGETFIPETFTQDQGSTERSPVIVSNAALIHALELLSHHAVQRNDGGLFVNAADTYWYYRFNFSQVDSDHLVVLTDGLKALLTSIANNPDAPPFVVSTTASGPLNIFLNYGDRLEVLGLPVGCLACMIGGLALFFVALTTNLLVDRQVEAITLLRSRGASVLQVFGSLLWQSVALGLIALALGPLLASLLVQLLARMMLAPANQSAIQLVSGQRLSVVFGLTGPALLVVGLAVLAMLFSIWRVVHFNVLVMQRESARAHGQPIWVRFKFDLLAAAVALFSSGFSLYIASPNILDVRARALILPVTTMCGLLFLLVGCLLLFLRVFPRLLHRGEHWAARGRGATPLLALAQIARAPRQSLRMTLLFSLALAFALFTLIFAQTQNRRLIDLSAYQVGGDFSGGLPDIQQGMERKQLLAWYRGIKGVTSVTLGYSEQMTGGSGNGLPISLLAVDATTYASTVYWPPQNGSEPIAALTSRLVAQRVDAEQQNVIPAIIDDAAAQSLQVKVGQQFVLKDFHGPLDYLVIAIVHAIPTIYDSASSTGQDAAISRGGILIDYQTDSVISRSVNLEAISPSNVWLRTSDSPEALANVRATLLTGAYALNGPEDRRALESIASSDPLNAAINGLLLNGAAVALLLGLLGNLLVSWLNARSRRGSFALLRALGGTPRQIAGVLLWEQGIVYAASLLLGILLSVVLALIALPAFIFSPLAGVDAAGTSAEAFYIVQSLPAVQIVVPLRPIASLLAALLAVCVIALGIIARVAVRPHVGQALRVDDRGV